MRKILVVLILVSLASCATKKEVLYFQDIDQAELAAVDSLYQHPKIQVNDILKIDITALEEETTLPFRFEKLQVQNNRQLDLLKLDGYLVGKDGTITYPQLGEIEVLGKSTQEVQTLLKNKLTAFIKDPSVKVRLINNKFTIMGEVKAPGTYTTTEEVVSLPQALGMAGDLTINGKRKNILIIRQTEGHQETKRIDLTQSDWLNTEYYYLKPNDIVYVEPNNPKVRSAGFIGSLGSLLSLASIMLSAAVIIFR
ncbi:polysaccharide biosynthesis/export family protein [Mesonia maritima]|uniref:Polysaccharide export outer membrane protein n=1 Tax=Mesonia maritima TaxID=1793873 RepID=A0ABU1K8A7_9FLAO|nr:polysaccharide biosynthesis/export family protein [Mesonia maritima]MDR6301826.1 polysaccharide export outer membrane protein [Mesonia maritima]